MRCVNQVFILFRLGLLLNFFKIDGRASLSNFLAHLLTLQYRHLASAFALLYSVQRELPIFELNDMEHDLLVVIDVLGLICMEKTPGLLGHGEFKDLVLEPELHSVLVAHY